MDILFYIGVALLPFENFFFAPSSGWAALSPLVFAVYVLCNYRFWGKAIARYRKLLPIFMWVIFITLVNFLFINQYEKEAFSRFISAFISLGLGIVSLLCFDIYLIAKKKSIEKMEDILFWAYTMSFLTGIAQFLTIKLNIGFLHTFDDIITKRSYLHHKRVQFTFTEPSFIGMHLFGVILPIFFYKKNTKLRNIIIIYGLFSVLVGSGVRILVDIAAVTGILLLYKLDFKKRKNIVLLILSIIVIVLGGTYIYNSNGRVRQIVNQGVYADGSFASRYFRINASIKGYQKNFLHVMLGYGLGQEIYPLKLGYSEARAEYRSSYIKEVLSLQSMEKTGEESVSYCLFIRVISECGLGSAIVLCVWISKKILRERDRNWKAVMLITTYLYIQFESYAFYSIWLVIVLMQLRNRNQVKMDREIPQIAPSFEE